MATGTLTIASIVDEPNPGALDNVLFAAYRQLRFLVTGSWSLGGVVPANIPMYADIYIGGYYYKTMSATTIFNSSGTSIFMFDIQDALQEALVTYIPEFGLDYSANIAQCFDAGFSYFAITDAIVQVYFRGCSIDTITGILTPAGLVPVQGTATTAPTNPYTGTPCNSFWVHNASYKTNPTNNIWDNDLKAFIAANQIIFADFLSDTEIYPFSNLPANNAISSGFALSPFNLNLCVNNYEVYNGVFPLKIERFGVSGSLSRYSRNCQLYVWWWNGSSNIVGGVAALTSGTVLLSAPFCYYLPVGIADIFTLNPSLKSTFENLSNNIYYSVVLLDVDGAEWCYFSPLYKYNKSVIEGTCLWFQNLYGAFETVTFARSDENFIVKSSEQFKPYTQPITPPPQPVTNNSLQYGLQTGRGRYNTRANDEITVTGVFTEELMPWLKELLSSPFVLQQIAPIVVSGVLFSADSFRAVKILDDTFNTKKTVTKAGIRYIVSFKMIPAIDYIQLRS